MKKLVLLSIAALMVLAGCKKEGVGTKITALDFKKGMYEINENEDINLFKELVTTPEGIKDTCKVTWKVSDPDVAEMDGKYLIPTQPGDVKVTATVQNISATCKVSILSVPVESITLEDMDVPLNRSVMIKCTTEPSVSIKRISFTSSDNEIATIGSDGMVEGKKEGDATITATVDGKEATCKVTVKKINVTSVVVTPASHRFHEQGETVQLTAKINPDDASVKTVTWSSSNPDVVSVTENGFVTCVSVGDAEITASADGKSGKCTIYVMGHGTVTDCQGNEYKTVKLGEQWWMAENLRVTKFSPNNTDSKNISISIVSAGAQCKNTPYCIDASNKSNWNAPEDWDPQYDELLSKFGYLYNWAAAVGVADGSTATTSFTGNRQGICPDGWHVPSYTEWDNLVDFVNSIEGETNMEGKHLKSVNGWYKGSDIYKPALDTYGFTILPAGGYQSGKIYSNARLGRFWTKDVNSSYPNSEAQNVYFSWYEDNMKYGSGKNDGLKKDAYSVRCVKN